MLIYRNEKYISVDILHHIFKVYISLYLFLYDFHSFNQLHHYLQAVFLYQRHLNAYNKVIVRHHDNV
jgi:hypothetical protein